MPSELGFEIMLVPVGALAVYFGSTAQGHMQIWSAPQLRGRVMAVYMLLTLGTTVVGGPFVGWVCQHWTPRAGLAVAGLATFAASLCVQLWRLRPKKSQINFQPSLAASTR